MIVVERNIIEASREKSEPPRPEWLGTPLNEGKKKPLRFSERFEV
jgi:hypothetical protein